MPELESILQEKRTFKPSKAFSAAAKIKTLAEYTRLYDESIKTPEKFWGRVAKELYWEKSWTKVLNWKAPNAQWFVGGKTNLAYNCLDRHL
ncbi:MAG: acetyl-coenzyme A synthetase, partial [Myxococcales bacterium]|nr:acetyl-coenzyme A synthetase [Myxococcales bacterium]